MTTVKNIEKHTNSQKEYIVCKGKLVFKEVPANAKVGSQWVEKQDKYYIPIIISEIEEIKGNDWFYDSLRNFIQRQTDKIKANGHIYFKILALFENFSPEILQQIINGELKDGDEVMVECKEEIAEGINFGMQVEYDEPPTEFFIKLTNNYINLIKK